MQRDQQRAMRAVCLTKPVKGETLAAYRTQQISTTASVPMPATCVGDRVPMRQRQRIAAESTQDRRQRLAALGISKLLQIASESAADRRHRLGAALCSPSAFFINMLAVVPLAHTPASAIQHNLHKCFTHTSTHTHTHTHTAQIHMFLCRV